MAILANTPIPTPSGWYLASQLKVGQYVFDNTGHATPITSIQTFTPTKCYSIVFDDYASVSGDISLRVEALNRWLRVDRWRRKPRKFPQNTRYMTVQDFLDKGVYRKDGMRLEYSMPLTKPVHFYSEDHPVPPFIVALWGKHHNKYDRFTIKPPVLEYVKRKIKEANWTPVHKKGNIVEIRPSIRPSFLTRYPTIPQTTPIDYYFGSVEQRLEFLRGYLAIRMPKFDPKKNKFVLESRLMTRLIKIQGVLESLGVKTNITAMKNRQPQLHFYTNLPIYPFQDPQVKTNRGMYRYIKKIVEIPAQPCVYIQTPAPMLATECYLTTWH